MEDKLRKDVEAVVAKIFSEKEEAEIRKQTEEALGKSATTIEELTSALETKNIEVEELEAKLTEADDNAKNLQTELEAARNEVVEANEKVKVSEDALEEIQKDRATELRMRELEVAGIISDKEAQSVKIRNMSDEEFASYKKELVSIREAVIAELSKQPAPQQAVEDKVKGKENTEEVVEEGVAEEDESKTAPPANIDPGKAISAALNMEIFPPKDMVSKYEELGKAMAKLFVKDEKND
jgi:chromosome segregation ATPase